MKTFDVLCAMLVFSVAPVWADNSSGSASSSGKNGLPPDTAYAVIDRKASHRVWEKTSYKLAPNGYAVAKTHRYTELATGLCYQNAQGQWVDAQEQINLLPDGSAGATQGLHQVYFPTDIAQGVIHLVTPDGQNLTSRPIGIGYDDGTQTVLFAQINDSTGELESSNQVDYPNCFTGLNAELLYTYKKGSFEQDVVLHQQPPDPASFGLNPATTKLQVLTEFFSSPEPTIQTHPAGNGNGPSDTALYFGKTIMGRGRAFLSSNGSGQPQSPGKDISVCKSWVKLQGRNFLIESVPLGQAMTQLQTLPKTAGKTKKPSDLKLCKASTTRLLPPARPMQSSSSKIQVAKRPLKLAPEFVMDYVELNEDTGDMALLGDTTYYVTGVVNVDGTLTIEGGTVVKYASSQIIQCWGAVVCETAPYRPAVFTFDGDNTVGESVAASGTPDYSFEALYIDNDATPLSNLRISYAACGIHDHLLTLSDAQFNDCVDGFQIEYWGHGGYSCNLTNVLMNNDQYPFAGTSYTVNGCNLTVSGCEQLGDDYLGAYDTANLVNSLVVGVTNNGYITTISTNCTAFPADTTLFQTAGGGDFYMTNGCPYRGAGTTNLDPATLADLAGKTTWPPVIYSVPDAYFSENLNLNPQAGRDISGTDLGYHYDPVDYLLGGIYATNCTINVNPGTVVGMYGTNYWEYGLAVADSAQLVCQGQAGNPVRLVEYSTVQEQTPSGWIIPWYGLVAHFNGNNFFLSFNFVDWSAPAQDAAFIQMTADNGPINFQNCEFYGGHVITSGPTYNFTNCLFFRVDTDHEPEDSVLSAVENNTIIGGTFGYYCSVDGGTVANNLFDGASIPDWFGGYGITYVGGHNAYVTNCDTLDPLMTGDVILTNSQDYQTSWFGNYYLPSDSPLIKAGSTNANLLGLYHFTTQTNQWPETNSIVDIGYHYVATGTNGLPLDSNGDGIPDYIEDANGDGLADDGETPWSIAMAGQPASQVAIQGDDIFFSASAEGITPISCQWYLNGSTPIMGATNAMLEIDNVQISDATNYFVVMSDSWGAVTSSVVSLAVESPSYTVLNGAYTNYIFQGDTTYYVNSAVQLYGTTTIEGGTVIKYGNRAGVQLTLNGPLNCLTGPYRPALLTTKDDNSAGQTISQSTGIPSGTNADVCLAFGAGQTNACKYLRIAYAGTGVLSAGAVDAWNCQVIQNGTGFASSGGGAISLHNVLLILSSNCVFTAGSFSGEYLTMDQCQNVCPVTGYTGANLTNSILTAVPNQAGVALIGSQVFSNGAGIYQSSGGGNYYLQTGSPCSGVATNGPSLGLLAGLAGQTTVSPEVYNIPGGYFSLDLNLVSQANRDTNALDLGYHYDAVDYIFGGIYVTNADIEASAGTVIGTYGTNDLTYGLAIADSARLICQGAAGNPVRVVMYNTVQEAFPAGWQIPAYGMVAHFNGENSELQFSFVDWSVLAQDAPHFQLNGDVRPVFFSDCEFYNGQLISGGMTCDLTNCLLIRVNADLTPSDTNQPVICNNTIVGGTFGFGPEQTNALVQNNLFDGATIPDWLGALGVSYVGGHNAFVTNFDTLDPILAGDLVLSNSPAYQSSWFGSFYLPAGSPLINAGSTTADQVGLYHFTTQTNQLPETNSIVDIGYHYVATGTNGLPLDSNGDGMPDYIEDANGDGLAGAGETPWCLAILSVPTNQTVIQGQNLTLGMAVGGVSPLSYQWFLDGTPIVVSNYVTTIAGLGPDYGWYYGDGGLAVNAGLNLPCGNAMDATGNLYIVDAWNNVIRMVDTNGMIWTVAGNHASGANYTGDGGAATNATLNFPQGIAVDGNGNIYIADCGNNVVREVNASGIITTVAGNGTNGYFGDGMAATNAELNAPCGVAVDGGGNIYIADSNNSLIRKVDTNGVITTVAGNYSLGAGYNGSNLSATNAKLNYPNSLTVDAAGNLYIADSENNLIRRVDTGGNITTVAGNLGGSYSGDGGAATNAQISGPCGIAIDGTGNLYIADTGNNMIRLVDTNGIISTVAGNGVENFNGFTGLAAAVEFNATDGGCVDANGNYIFCDVYNNVVRKLAFANFSGSVSNGALTIPVAMANQEGSYQVEIDNGCASLTSSNIVLTVLSPPAILTQPANLGMIVGGSGSLGVLAAGTDFLFYQWYKSTGSIGGATNPMLNFTNAVGSMAGYYSVTVSNLYGMATSSVVYVNIYSPLVAASPSPLILNPPASQSTYPGGDTTFSVLATNQPCFYQWLFNGTNIATATNSAYSLANVQSTNSGTYTVVVTNLGGSVTSPPALLNVQAVQVFSGSSTGFTFKSDSTYFISNTATISGAATLEGGTVIKFSTNGSLAVSGAVICLTGPYRPAIFTSKDDNSVGLIVPGSSGQPLMANAGNAYLFIHGLTYNEPDWFDPSSYATNAYFPYTSSGDMVVSYLRFAYADKGIAISSGLGGIRIPEAYEGNLHLWNCQFIKCNWGVANWFDEQYAVYDLHNTLFSGCSNAVAGGTGYNLPLIIGEQVTSETVSFWNTNYPLGTLTLTNSVLTGGFEIGSATLATNCVFINPTGQVFQVVGAANYYLASNSVCRAAGTTNITPAMLAEINQKTTWPPVVLAQTTISTNLTLNQAVQRDTNSVPDVGYHYDPLDYAVGACDVTNATLTIGAGITVGVFGTNSVLYGIRLDGNSAFVSQGLANDLTRITGFASVQEQSGSNWVTASQATLADTEPGATASVNSGFTDWSVLAQDAPHLFLTNGARVWLANSQFHGGQLNTWYPVVFMTNCLWERVDGTLESADGNIPGIRNNLFYAGTFGFRAWLVTNAVVRDNLFVGTVLPDWIGGIGNTYAGGHNAYVTNSGTLDPAYANDVILTNAPAFQSSWFGNYYLPTNSPLIRAGSTTADQVGLYHFTTLTNQVPETNAVVDIGYHYVATDVYGNPLNSNGSGVPDYLEDANGNGLLDPGELPFGITIENPASGVIVY